MAANQSPSCQAQAIAYVEAQVDESLKDEAKTGLEHKQVMLQKLQSCPIALQFKGSKTLPSLLRDRYYRNMFEVQTSNGSNSIIKRKEWEDRLFGGAYHEVHPRDRVKYGYLYGLTRNRLTYGDCLLVLKDHVKSRCTYTVGDSSQESSVAYSYDDMIHLLSSRHAQYQTHQSTWKFKWQYDEYIEVQIHGPIDLTNDVELLILNETYQSDRKMTQLANQFATDKGCQIAYKKL